MYNYNDDRNHPLDNDWFGGNMAQIYREDYAMEIDTEKFPDLPVIKIIIIIIIIIVITKMLIIYHNNDDKHPALGND